MASLVGNIDHIVQGQSLIESLSGGELDEFTIRDDLGNLKQSYVGNKCIERLYSAGYPDPVSSGTRFFAGIDFSAELVLKLDELFGTIAIKCQLKRVDTGRVSPPRADSLDPERKFRLESLGILETYHVHIGEPAIGQVFMIEKEALHMQPSGTCFRWDDYRSINSIGNVSYRPVHILIYKGIRPAEYFKRTYEYSKKPDNITIVLEDGSKI